MKDNAHDALRLNYLLDTAMGLEITHIDASTDIAKLKAWLLNHYAGTIEVEFFIGSRDKWKNNGAKEQIRFPLSELDRQENYGFDSVLRIAPQYDPECVFSKERYGFADLVRITERLSAPDGCPWDQAQTHASIAANAIEEANELSEAIAANDIDNILEESGDVLLQGVFHGDIARRAGEFTVHDVVDRVCKKLVSRHTHVFGSDKAADADEALAFWKAAKKREK